MKRYVPLVLAVLTALAALFSGCDPRGRLNGSEAQALYSEFKEPAESEEFRQRKALPRLDGERVICVEDKEPDSQARTLVAEVEFY
ncbi:MAG: hypothetical protein K6G56_01655 [Clostridiales bacterium]|nr:hypothetical protein [Clostridiales bacterium]